MMNSMVSSRGISGTKDLPALPKKQIDVVLVKEFYSNVYDPDDGSPKQCQKRGWTIRFNAQMLNDFLGTPIILPELEQLTTYSQYNVAPCRACRPWIFFINGILFFLKINGSGMEKEER